MSEDPSKQSMDPNDAEPNTPSDLLATILAASAVAAPESLQDQEVASHAKCDEVGFLKLFLAKASAPEYKEVDIEEGVKILYLLEQCKSSDVELNQDEMDEMANGILNVMEDPNWNRNSAAELICQTRTIQEKAVKIKRPASVDETYGTGTLLTWDDPDTVLLLSASELYLKYKSQFQELSAKNVSLFMLPYFKSMLILKMIAEVQSQSKRRKCVHEHTEAPKETEGKAKSGRGKPGAKDGRAGLKPSLPLVSQLESSSVDQREIGTRASHPQTVIDGGVGTRAPHPQTVIDSAVDWIRHSNGIDVKPRRYYRSLCTMWTSGEFNWARDQPMPTQTQVYYWLKNSRRENPPVVDRTAVSEKQRKFQAHQSLKKLAVAFKLREQNYPAGSRGQCSLAKCLDTLLLLFVNDHSYKHVLLCAQTSKLINLRIKRSEAYIQVQRIMQGRMVDIDARLVLAQMDLGNVLAVGSIAKQPSSQQILVDFSNLAVSLQANASKGLRGDFRDTIINLGDAFGMDRLFYVGEGGFGSVFSDPHTRMAIKIFKRPGPLEQVVRDVANEASCCHLSSTLNRMGLRGISSLRSKFFPFSPLPLNQKTVSTSGAIALPSWGLGDGVFYPALVMELAVGSINEESRQLSKSFFSNPMGLVSDEGFIRLAALMKLIAEPLASMHSLNLAHRDVKEDNILALRIAPGVKGSIYYNTAGKKWTGRLGDCGKALCFDVEFETETGASVSAASKRARSAVGAIEIPAHEIKQTKLDFPRDMFKVPPDMPSRTGTVPLVIPMSIIHMINPVAPSTQTQAKSDVIRRKAPAYSGTMTYTPPEPIPPRPAHKPFLTSRDYQPGDMWSLGVVLANVLGGSGIRLSMISSHDKALFAEAQDRVIWTKLNKLPAALDSKGRIPDQWTDVMDLLRSLTRLNPHDRMTAAEVLEHPFLKKADMLARMCSS